MEHVWSPEREWLGLIFDFIHVQQVLGAGLWFPDKNINVFLPSHNVKIGAKNVSLVVAEKCRMQVTIAGKGIFLNDPHCCSEGQPTQTPSPWHGTYIRTLQRRNEGKKQRASLKSKPHSTPAASTNALMYSLSISTCTYIYIYIHIDIESCIYIYIHNHTLHIHIYSHTYV